MTLSESLERAFAEAYNRQAPSETVVFPRGLHVQVRHAEDGLRRIKAWRDSGRPSRTEIRVLARDAGFKQWHHEYPPSGFAVIVLEDHNTVQDAEIERAAKARGDLRASERGRLEEDLMKLWAELHRVHPDKLDGYRELWRMRFEQESLEWVRAELDAARVAIKRDGLRKPEKLEPNGVLFFE